jgi:hypothetical protein
LNLVILVKKSCFEARSFVDKDTAPLDPQTLWTPEGIEVGPNEKETRSLETNCMFGRTEECKEIEGVDAEHTCVMDRKPRR